MIVSKMFPCMLISVLIDTVTEIISAYNDLSSSRITFFFFQTKFFLFFFSSDVCFSTMLLRDDVNTRE